MEYFVCNIKPKEKLTKYHKNIDSKVVGFPFFCKVGKSAKFSTNEYNVATSPVKKICIKTTKEDFDLDDVNEFKEEIASIDSIDIETENTNYHFFKIGPYSPEEVEIV